MNIRPSTYLELAVEIIKLKANTMDERLRKIDTGSNLNTYRMITAIKI
jgi:hypothetical protein